METNNSLKFLDSSIAISKYLTYKEWKPSAIYISASLSIFDRVSTLPIRNGNAMSLASQRDLQKVSTLPISNGNYIKYFIP